MNYWTLKNGNRSLTVSKLSYLIIAKIIKKKITLILYYGVVI